MPAFFTHLKSGDRAVGVVISSTEITKAFHRLEDFVAGIKAATDVDLSIEYMRGHPMRGETYWELGSDALVRELRPMLEEKL